MSGSHRCSLPKTFTSMISIIKRGTPVGTWRSVGCVYFVGVQWHGWLLWPWLGILRFPFPLAGHHRHNPPACPVCLCCPAPTVLQSRVLESFGVGCHAVHAQVFTRQPQESTCQGTLIAAAPVWGFWTVCNMLHDLLTFNTYIGLHSYHCINRP